MFTRAKIAIWEYVLGGLAVLAPLAAGVVYWSRFHASPPGNPDAWGQFGDFVGGTVNPLIGIITVIFVLVTLNETRSQVERARVDAEAADIRRKVEGILETWNQHITAARFNGVIGVDLGDGPVDVDLTLSRLFEDDSYTLLMQRARETDQRLIIRSWHARFDRAVNLLIEFENALLEYQDYADSRSLTDYYRRRVSTAAVFLKKCGLLPDETAKGLSVLSIRDAKERAARILGTQWQEG
ncbi:hypothetical protein [Tahibacter sp.]|uniref:hypothetical protein n=1 Tax=Tahibacter sp. TaxID=2056211 RepID=UPI0028C47B04|nr:hypothetical protein [Tahibacter sp.]